MSAMERKFTTDFWVNFDSIFHVPCSNSHGAEFFTVFSTQGTIFSLFDHSHVSVSAYFPSKGTKWI